jgi:5'-nucleotidase
MTESDSTTTSSMMTASRKRVVLVDMDNTIVDLNGGLIKYLTETYPDRKDEWEARIRDRKEFEFDEALDALTRPTMLQKGFFANLDPLPGAIGKLHDLVQEGYHVVLLTSAIRDSDYCVGDKCKWVRKHLGSRSDRELLIVAKDKTLVFGDYLIDDKPEQTGFQCVPPWNHIVFDQPYNAHITSKLRLKSWDSDVVALLKQADAATMSQTAA